MNFLLLNVFSLLFISHRVSWVLPVVALKSVFVWIEYILSNPSLNHFYADYLTIALFVIKQFVCFIFVSFLLFLSLFFFLFWFVCLILHNCTSKWSTFSCHIFNVFTAFFFFFFFFFGCFLFNVLAYINTQHTSYVSNRPWDWNRTTNATNKQEWTLKTEKKEWKKGEKLKETRR